MRYRGWYSSRSRGERKKRGLLGGRVRPPRYASECRPSWAVLIKKVWLQDPLVCERCGGEARITEFVTEPVEIEAALRRKGLWAPASPGPARAPPEFELLRVDEDGVLLDQTVVP